MSPVLSVAENPQPHAKGWFLMPAEYRTKANYGVFCYMASKGIDALELFRNEIQRKQENDRHRTT